MQTFNTVKEVLPIPTEVNVIDSYDSHYLIDFDKYKEGINHAFKCKNKNDWHNYLDNFDSYDAEIFEDIADYYKIKTAWIDTRPSKGEGYFIFYKEEKWHLHKQNTN